MPIHDWTRVDAGIFHDFHLGWISALSRALNGGLLPGDCYALIERANPEPEPIPDVVISPKDESVRNLRRDPPQVQFHMTAEPDAYARKRSRIAIRDTSDHQLMALVDIVSPGNKSGRSNLRTFVDTNVNLLYASVHLLILDLFPPGPRDPQGIHKAIWDELTDDEFALSPDKPLTLVAYVAGLSTLAFIEPIAVGNALPEMPLFLSPDVYIPVPLEATYQYAWTAVPAFYRDLLTRDVSL